MLFRTSPFPSLTFSLTSLYVIGISNLKYARHLQVHRSYFAKLLFAYNTEEAFLYYKPGFRIRIFFLADPDPVPDSDPDPDPGGIRGRGLGVKGKMNFFLRFFHVSDDS